MVRNTAAYTLGGIGDPVAIPPLIDTMDNDHEQDELGHPAGGCAATALDNLLKTNYTRLKFADGLCTGIELCRVHEGSVDCATPDTEQSATSR